MSKVTYLDDLQQMQADHIWGKVSKMRKQKRVAQVWFMELAPTDEGIKRAKVKFAPYTAYRIYTAACIAGRAGRVARKLIQLGDY